MSYAVFGQPIAGSLSPRIHQRFGDQFGLTVDYRVIETAPADFPAALARFAATGGRGANISMPLKRQAFALCQSVSARARRAGSVNTLTRGGEGWLGDTTDGVGLIRDLDQRRHVALGGCRCMLLGAGGAAVVVAFALVDAGVAELLIVNRTSVRADELAARVAAAGRVRSIGRSELARCGPVDLLIDATAAGNRGAAPDLPAGLVGSHSVCYTLSYGPAALAFLAWSRSAGAARTLDGVGMLVEQAAESFAIWHGRRPDTAPVHAELRAAPAGARADRVS